MSNFRTTENSYRGRDIWREVPWYVNTLPAGQVSPHCAMTSCQATEPTVALSKQKPRTHVKHG